MDSTRVLNEPKTSYSIFDSKSSHNKANNAKTCLGKVRLTSTSFVPYTEAIPNSFPKEKNVYWLGLDEFDPRGETVVKLLKEICSKPGVDCTNLLTSFTGQNCCLNSSIVNMFLVHEPQPSATKNMVHLAQMIRQGTITMYDYVDVVENMKHYGQPTPPAYNMTGIPNDFPLFVSYGGADALADVNDVYTTSSYPIVVSVAELFERMGMGSEPDGFRPDRVSNRCNLSGNAIGYAGLSSSKPSSIRTSTILASLSSPLFSNLPSVRVLWSSSIVLASPCVFVPLCVIPDTPGTRKCEYSDLNTSTWQLILPKGVIRDVEKLCMRFFWKGCDSPARGARKILAGEGSLWIAWVNSYCLRLVGVKLGGFLAPVVAGTKSMPDGYEITFGIGVRKLPIKDRLSRFGIVIDGGCGLCSSGLESQDHIFLTVHIQRKSGLLFFFLVVFLRPLPTGMVLKLAWTGFIYFIWEERNRRYFGGTHRLVGVVVSCIKESVRIKLHRTHINRIDVVNRELCIDWGLV
ncbi:triacylglycerol lipase 2-like [Hibiscus syriacus]|uniref:Triacylglycerol lipase 2-like n=1 Tax=Hibiscus syriacus TaxID=106335 RepID=A0A6A2ZYE8_HIBSY|nr:triacylglycerol lipase 2-like [Hibiscus syriacus]